MDQAWIVHLEIDGILQVASSEYFTSSVKYSPLTLDFSASTAGSSPSVDADSVRGSFNIELDSSVPIVHGQVGNTGVKQSGTQITKPQVTFTRKVTYDETPELNIDDGGGQPEGTIDIDGQTTLGGLDVSTWAGPLHASTSTTVAAPVHLRANYGVENPTSDTVKTEPDDHTIKGSVTLTIQRNIASIKMREVSAEGTDVTERPDVAKGKTYTRGTPQQTVNYLYDTPTKAAFIHANILLTVVGPDGKDETAGFEAVRWMRTWMVNLKPLKKGQDPTDGDGGLAGRAAAPDVEQGWHEDGTGWYDVPGTILMADRVMASREIQEFLWSAKNYADLIPPIYYLVVTDTRPPGWYRIRVYQPKVLTLKQYASIRSSAKPWQSEGSSDLVYDSHWVKMATP